MEVLTTLEPNAKHRCWLLTLHFFLVVTPTQNSSLQSMCSRVWQMLYSLRPPPPPSTHSPQRFVFQKFQYCPRLSVSRLILDWWIGSFILGINIFVQPNTIFVIGPWSTHRSDLCFIFVSHTNSDLDNSILISDKIFPSTILFWKHLNLSRLFIYSLSYNMMKTNLPYYTNSDKWDICEGGSVYNK